MLLTLIVAGALFAGMIAILAFGYQQIEQERNEAADAVLASAPAAQPGRCMLCNAPLRRTSTVDEVVFELEHRIDAELRDVSQVLLRSSPDGLSRLYRA